MSIVYCYTHRKPGNSITSQPSNVTQCVGSTASFTVAASGTAPITYQWQKFIASVGPTLATLVISAGLLQIFTNPISIHRCSSYRCVFIAIADPMSIVMLPPSREPGNTITSQPSNVLSVQALPLHSLLQPRNSADYLSMAEIYRFGLDQP